ncbi:MAG: protein kinase domain-containing protein [Planctomycetaceae bacterium]
MESKPRSARANLLETMVSDSLLIERLSQSYSTSMTLSIQIDSDGAALLPNAGPLIPAASSPAEKPLATSRPAAAELAGGEGFVPARAIAGPGVQATSSTDYRLVGKLGSGGTGIVYQAHQRAIDREVAVKVLRDELACDALSRMRFLQEARTLGSLDHPNVIALHELGTGPDGELFYSMKRVEGTSWNRTIDELSTSENIDILLRVANAIRYAHSRGLIHRDIKPENVMIGPFGEVLVADWGLALSFTGEHRRIVTGNTIGGTPAYMAPELAAGTLETQSIRTDVYLLGAVLYRIMTGHAPHAGATLLECIRAAAANKIVPTSVTGGWIDIATRAMATDPQDRYVDVAAFAAAIGQQQLHQQSEDLVRRAQKRIAVAGPAVTHQDYSVAEALIRESLDVWPGNLNATRALSQLHFEHARAAAAHGDYDLALVLLGDIGMGDSELASRVRRDRQHRLDQASREAKFLALFTHSPDAGLLTTAATSEILEANTQFERLTGFPAAEVVGRRIPDIHLWGCPERRSLFIKQLIETGHVEDFETPLRRSDGTFIDASLSANQFQMNGSELILTTIRDVGLRKEMQSQLRQSRQRLQDLQHLAQLGTWELNVRTGEVRWSDETFQIVGRALEHGAPDMEEYVRMIHPDDQQRLLDAIKTSIAHRAAYELQLRHRRPDGSYSTVIARGQPNLDEAGNVIELYGVVIDITRQAQEIEALRQQVVARSGGQRAGGQTTIA